MIAFGWFDCESILESVGRQVWKLEAGSWKLGVALGVVCFAFSYEITKFGDIR